VAFSLVVRIHSALFSSDFVFERWLFFLLFSSHPRFSPPLEFHCMNFFIMDPFSHFFSSSRVVLLPSYFDDLSRLLSPLPTRGSIITLLSWCIFPVTSHTLQGFFGSLSRFPFFPFSPFNGQLFFPSLRDYSQVPFRPISPSLLGSPLYMPPPLPDLGAAAFPVFFPFARVFLPRPVGLAGCPLSLVKDERPSWAL